LEFCFLTEVLIIEVLIRVNTFTFQDSSEQNHGFKIFLSCVYCGFIIIIIGKDTISYMHGIYTYIPETNHVPKQYSVTAILSLLFMVPISLAPALALMYFYIIIIIIIIIMDFLFSFLKLWFMRFLCCNWILNWELEWKGWLWRNDKIIEWNTF
jgi:hypothetical protein